MRVLFFTYLTLVVAGLAYLIAIGLRDRRWSATASSTTTSCFTTVTRSRSDAT